MPWGWSFCIAPLRHSLNFFYLHVDLFSKIGDIFLNYTLRCIFQVAYFFFFSVRNANKSFQGWRKDGEEEGKRREQPPLAGTGGPSQWPQLQGLFPVCVVGNTGCSSLRHRGFGPSRLRSFLPSTPGIPSAAQLPGRVTWASQEDLRKISNLSGRFLR